MLFTSTIFPLHSSTSDLIINIKTIIYDLTFFFHSNIIALSLCFLGYEHLFPLLWMKFPTIINNMPIFIIMRIMLTRFCANGSIILFLLFSFSLILGFTSLLFSFGANTFEALKWPSLFPIFFKILCFHISFIKVNRIK